MEYITHRRFRGKAADGTDMNIPYGTTFETIGDFIATPEGKAICYDTSETAHKYFARNDDGQGTRRGKLTYAIAYGPRRTCTGYRLTDAEREMLETKWSKYLIPDIEVVLFNHDFFNSEVGPLEKIADALNIKVKS